MEKSQQTELALVVSGPALLAILLTIVAVSFLLYKVISLRGGSQSVNGDSQNQEGVLSEENGKQIITILARGAYSPRSVTAKGGVPTILRMKTSNSYGCERSFAIPKLSIQESLPATGETDIDLGTPEAGSKIFGTCSMGMYTVTISFN